MLLAQRKRRQRLACKIGHSEEEYQVGHQHILAAPSGNVPCRFLCRKPDVNPISWQEKQPYPQQQQQPQYLQHYPQYPQQQRAPPAEAHERSPLFLQGVSPGPLPVSPRPPLLPPLHAAPLLPHPAVVNTSPMRFRSALSNAPPVVPTPQISPRFVAAPLVVPTAQISPRFAAAPPVVPTAQISPRLVTASPLPSLSPKEFHGYSTPTPALLQDHMGFGNNNNVHRRFNNEFRSQLGRAVSPVTAYPQGNDDTLEARRKARERAIELQNENARLCEERRLRRQMEKQRESEELRQMEDLARRQRGNLFQKEREEVKREVLERETKTMGRRKSSLVGTNSDAQIQADLRQQAERMRTLEEAPRRFAGEENKAETNFTQVLRENLTNEGGNIGFSAAGKKEADFAQPLQGSTLFVPPLLSSGAADFSTPPLDNLFSHRAGLSGSSWVPPPPPPPPPPSSFLDGATALPTAPLGGFEPTAAFSGAGINAASWLPPQPTPPRPHSVHKDQYESQLRDMIANHTNLQCMLEKEVQQSAEATPRATTTTTTVPLTLPLETPSVTFAVPQTHLEPLNLSFAKNNIDPLGANNSGAGVTTGLEPLSFLPPGILKTPSERPAHIPLATADPTPLSKGAAAAAAAPAATSSTLPTLKVDADELSAEPSRFIGAEP